MTFPRASLLRRLSWWLRGGPARLRAARARREVVRGLRAVKIAPTMELRAAVHEAGHAVAAWCCTATAGISSVHIDASGGAVTHTTRAGRPAEAWCRLVILLSGVAAEGALFGCWRSGQAEDDLLRARDLAEELRDTPAPWTLDPVPCAAEKAFRSLSAGARRALRLGYTMARRLVRAQMRRLCLLVGSLLHLRRLDGAAVAAVLGSRATMLLLGAFGRADFILKRP